MTLLGDLAQIAAVVVAAILGSIGVWIAYKALKVQEAQLLLQWAQRSGAGPSDGKPVDEMFLKQFLKAILEAIAPYFVPFGLVMAGVGSVSSGLIILFDAWFFPDSVLWAALGLIVIGMLEVSLAPPIMKR